MKHVKTIHLKHILLVCFYLVCNRTNLTLEDLFSWTVIVLETTLDIPVIKQVRCSVFPIKKGRVISDLGSCLKLIMLTLRSCFGCVNRSLCMYYKQKYKLRHNNQIRLIRLVKFNLISSLWSFQPYFVKQLL